MLSLFVGPLLLGYALDLLIGDPDDWPHPVRIYGNLIAYGERRLNRGPFRFGKGAALTISLCILTYGFFWVLNQVLLASHPIAFVLTNSLWVWYGLANHNLIKEGKAVFRVLEKDGLNAGRWQLSRIVGRDTTQLTPQQIRVAVLETMSENLSDGVIAPLFFYGLAGVPGMMTYKLINTLDSMIGYRNERYEQFGKLAARLDDIANFIPARLTALLIVAVTGSRRSWQFVVQFGHQHKSPNAGYPEAALAGVLDCRFGGPNVYHGVWINKPFIGKNNRLIEPTAIQRTSRINHLTCLLMIASLIGCSILLRSL